MIGSTRRTPTKAIVTFVIISLLIIGGWGLGHAVGYAAYLVRRDPGIGERVGSIVADAQEPPRLSR